MKNICAGAAFALVSVIGAINSSHAQQASNADGERLFQTRCESCHSLTEGQNRAGPHLFSIVGRSAGSIEGAQYSKALSGSGFIWDHQRLNAFLENPRQAVPGTTMTVSVRDQGQRSAIISYLQNLSTAK